MRLPTIAALLGLAFHSFAADYEGVTASGYIHHFALKESSGLVASRRYPGVLWSHNDGGFQFLFAMDKRGNSIGAFNVPGKLVDWEDLGIDNFGNLYLADTGSDGMVRTHVAVHRVKEPNPYKRFGTAQINRSWYLKFPEGPIQDCEAFFVRGNFGYLINRRPDNDAKVNMYRFSLLDTRRSIPLQLIARIPMESPVTGASLSFDSQRLGLTTSEGVYVLLIEGRPVSASYAPRVFLEHHDFFMEGGTFFKDGFLTSAELTGEILWWTSSAFRCQETPRITSPPRERAVSAGKPIRLDVTASGCPVPQFKWFLNGNLLPGATNSFLDFTSASPADAGTYHVIAFNRYGADTNIAATLKVRTRPDIRITEVSSSQAIDAIVPTADWFELSNFEADPVDISGWRFNDGIGFLTDPFVIPEGVIIEPGVSVIFVENLLREQFTAWWGRIDVPIMTYSGPGLSFKATEDTLFLWDATATDPADYVTRAHFGAAEPGVTFIYNPDTEQFGQTSQLGIYGAIRAANSSDIGSPGRF